jgi:alpha-L-rhamnosidase
MLFRPFLSFVFFFPWLTLANSASLADEVPSPLEAPTGLMVDLLRFPERTIIDRSEPWFSWIINDPRRGARQVAWQIQLRQVNADTPLWDSGKVSSADSVAVPYQGPELLAGTTYQWHVRTWNEQDAVSPWSQTQFFHTADRMHPGYRLTHSEGANQNFTNRPALLMNWDVPVKSVQLASDRWYFEFDKAAFGNLAIIWEEPPAGSELSVHLAEKLAGDYQLDRQPPGSVRYQQHSLRFQEGIQLHQPALHWTPPGWMKEGFLGLSPGLAQVMPFRFALLENVPPGFRPAMVQRGWLSIPFDEQAARFESSRPGLDTIWELCRYTIQATSFAGLYVDGDRERKPYEADTYVNQLAHYNVDRSYGMARHTLEYLLQRPTWPLEWHPFTVMIAWEDYLHTGDLRSLAVSYDQLSVKTLVDLARDDGLIDVSLQTPELLAALNLGESLRIVVDWPPGERDQHQITNVDAVANAFHYRALVLMQKIADVLERPEEAAIWGERAARVRAQYQQVFFDTDTGRYRDGEGVAHSSLHANLFPLAFDLVPEAHQATVLESVQSRGAACSVYAAHFLLEILFRHGEPQAAIELIDSRGVRSWHNMIKQGATMTMEAWDQRYKTNQDWNHPWATGPVAAIGRYLVGVTPLEAGYRRLRVAPQPGDLDWFTAQIPTLRGPVRMKWSKSSGEVNCQLELPANTQVEFLLPNASWETVRESGRLVLESSDLTLRESSDGRQVLELGGGTYEFTFPNASPE